MATCLILMFGRLGAVSGSNFVGLLLNTNCELIFYVYGALILSKLELCSLIDIHFFPWILFKIAHDLLT